VLKYLFAHSLNDEVIDYIESEYFQCYVHVEKAIVLAKSLGLNDSGILDVGGAIGNTAILFAKKNPNSHIWVFEPILETRSKLTNAVSTYNNITIVPKAVGNSIGRTVINMANRITSSSILSLKTEQNSKAFSDTLIKQGEEEIEITTLDSEIPHDKKISILKIDVQGYELEVLKGAADTLRRTAVVVLELNNHENYEGSPKYYQLDECMRQNGFILYDIFPSLKDKGRLKEWDTIYLRKDLA